MDKNTDELNRLYFRLYELDQQSEKNKKIRHILLTLVFIVIRMIFICCIGEPQGIEEIALAFVVSAIWGTAAHWFYFYLFAYHFVKSREEAELIQHIKNEISKLEKNK